MKKILLTIKLVILIILITGCANTPNNFKVKRISTTSVKLAWEKTKWASSYKIYRSEEVDGNFIEIYTTENNEYEDMGLKSGGTYYYKISAISIGTGKESLLSDKVEAITELLVPSNLKVTSVNNKVFLDWYSVKEAEGYKIYRAEKEQGEYVLVGESKVNSYEDNQLESGKDYYYKIKAFKGKAESAFSKIVYIKSGMGAPKNVNAATSGINSIVITWDPVEGATNYYVYRSRNENGNFDEIGFTEVPRYEDKNLISGRIYYYKIKASGKSVESQLSDSTYAMTKVGAPNNIRVKQVTQETVTIIWDNVDLADGYKIYRSDINNKNYKELDYTLDNSYTDKGLEPNTVYYYKITAYIGKTESDFSDEKKIETSPQIITLKIIKSGLTDVKIGWSKISGVKKYIVYRSEKMDSGYEVIGETSEPNFSDDGLSPEKDYYYRVKGYKGSQEINSTILVVKSVNDNKLENSNLNTESKNKNYSISCVDVNYSYNIVAGGTSDDSIKLWQLSTGDFIGTLSGHTKDITCIKFSPDGSILASGDLSGTIKIWGMPDGNLLKTIKAHNGKVGSIDLAIDNKIMVTGGFDKLVKVWDINTGKEIRTFKGHDDGITAVTIFNDNIRVASGSNDKTIKLWSLDNGKLLKTLIDKYVVGGTKLENYNVGEVTSISVDLTGQRIVSGNSDNKVKIWDISSGELIGSLKGHTDAVSGVAFNKQGNKVISTSFDKTVRVWDISTSASSKWFEAARSEYFNGHSEFITGISIGKDNNIYTSSKDGSIKMWDINTMKVIKTFVEK